MEEGHRESHDEQHREEGHRESHDEKHGENHGKKHSESHHVEKSKDITINKTTLWMMISGILGVLLILSVFTNGFTFKSAGSSNTVNIVDAQKAQPRNNQPSNQPSQPSAPSIDMVSLADDDTVLGSKDAPVTMIEWSDFECPFCERFYSQTLGQIEETYIKTGKVKFVYRDFPLNFHPNAQKAAEAAECADEQGKFREMHDKLFEDGVQGGVASFKQFAADLGLNTAKFNDCLDSGKMSSEVQKDLADGQRAGITGTPGFIINGKLVSGALPFESFKQVIDAELAKANQ